MFTFDDELTRLTKIESKLKQTCSENRQNSLFTSDVWRTYLERKCVSVSLIISPLRRASLNCILRIIACSKVFQITGYKNTLNEMLVKAENNFRRATIRILKLFPQSFRWKLINIATHSSPFEPESSRSHSP